jgi:3-dehydroquinate dehydratase type I
MLILSIPYLNNAFLADQVKRTGLEWIEYRLDYNSEYKKFPEKYINLKSIITIRDVSEGGARQINRKEKTEFYKNVIDKFDCLVDYEISQYKDQDILTPNLILSYHDFSEEINIQKLEKAVETSNSKAAKYLKIAVNISSYNELNFIKKIIKKSNKPVIFAAMGKLGKTGRILHKHLGSAGTFVGLKHHTTADSQLTDDEAATLQLKDINEKTSLGGIVGGEQVWQSLGLKFYNTIFKKRNHNAVYLPFFTDNLSDFISWFNSTDFKDRFYGFSVTMPFKKEITKLLDPQDLINHPVNLFLPKSMRTFNSDVEAFLKCIHYLNIKTKNKVLILGSGATAESALMALAGYSICITSRKEHKGKELAVKYSREFIPINEIDQHDFVILINCTPLGMNNEDVLTKLRIKLPKKIIDLPYKEKNTLLIKHCIENEINYVDGKMFWKWQAESQLKKFLNELDYLGGNNEKN